MAEKTKKKENPLPNLLFNIIIPVVILNQLTKRLGEDGPTIALIAALIFPTVYGLWDYFKNHNKNIISALGVINILMTGGLALFHLEGIWFAVKEAAFPLIIGLFVYLSTFTKKPAMNLLLYNDNLMNVSKIDLILEKNGNKSSFLEHLKISTVFLSLSFLLSAVLNYFLARYIFIDIDKSISLSEQSAILNQQIADMHWMGFVVIALPLTIFTGLILFHLIQGIKKFTHLDLEEIFPSLSTPVKSEKS
ncbi:MAG: hypothetical protein HOO06_04740 [Bdellovibrionaceae bacterium]|nr:hypothetical protein [Pseudobdellovibrionaceae bacterium]